MVAKIRPSSQWRLHYYIAHASTSGAYRHACHFCGGFAAKYKFSTSQPKDRRYHL